MLRNSKTAQWLVAACLCGGLTVAAGCSSSNSSGTGGGATTGSSGSGTPQGEPGVPAAGIVSAGGVATSSKYQLQFAVGQSTQNIGKSTSASHTVRGGVVGANGDTSK